MNKLIIGLIKVFLKLTMGMCIIGMLWGCGEDSSTIYQTEDISADMRVTSLSDNSTEVKVYLRADSEELDLVGTDRLEATVNGQKKKLIEIEDYCKTTFNNLDGGTKIQISFYRDGWDDAKESEVRLPSRFEITAPERGTVVSGDTPVTFNWSPSGSNDAMWLTTTYECQDSSSNGGSDTHKGTGPRINLDDLQGSAALTLTDLLDVSQPAQTYDRGCSRITVKIVRERFGDIDPEYESGDISARQEREVSFSYQP